jgi:hypothetical protein
MTVKTIKEIHSRLLANFGGIDLPTEEIDDNLDCSSGKVSTKESLPETPPPVVLVKAAVDKPASDFNNPPKVYGSNTETQIRSVAPVIRRGHIRRHLFG